MTEKPVPEGSHEKKQLDQKPELSLLPGTSLKDAKVLARLFHKLTGREATREEIEEAQYMLDSKKL